MGFLTKIHDWLYAERPRNPQCSFCGRKYLDVGKLLVEGKDGVLICDSCIDGARASMYEEKRRRGLTPTGESSSAISPAEVPNSSSEEWK